jgi:hypothetical protein
MPTPTTAALTVLQTSKISLNSVGASGNLVNRIIAQSKGTQQAQVMQMIGQMGGSHQDQINLLLQDLRAVQADLATLLALIQIINPSLLGYNVLTIVGGAVTPDLSKGLLQYVLLNQDIIVNDPINFTGTTQWTLIMDEDGTGNWTASPDQNYYFSNFSLISGPNTRMQANWVLDPAGFNSLSGAPSFGQPIPS